MRILIVDDDATILDLLDDLLTDAGYQVTRASGGREALQLFDSGRFQLAIVDWQMPEIDGLELLKTIRSSIKGMHIYAILLSGRIEQEDIVAGLSAGADDYLCKPFNPNELLLRLHNAKRIVALGTRHVAIFAMAKLAEARDPDTGQHLERIRAYSWVLARRLAGEFPEITTEYLETLYQTSVLHDIGKVGTPDCILLKPDRLTDREFEVIKTHTVIGAETLAAAAREFPDIEFFTMAREIALTHHENFDGTGYPGGLRGREIPLCGRLVALADVYDALTNQRPYKPAFGHEVAKGIILERQEHFDPFVLKAFLDMEDEFLSIRDLFSDRESTPTLSEVEF